MVNKHQFYLDIAKTISKASYCKRLQVGALLVKDDNIISFGYNGTPKGFDNQCECDGKTKPEVLHAESNCITKCALSTYSSKNSIMYTTHSPCVECAKLIIQCEIKELYFSIEYRDNSGIKLLEKNNIYVKHIQ